MTSKFIGITPDWLTKSSPTLGVVTMLALSSVGCKGAMSVTPPRIDAEFAQECSVAMQFAYGRNLAPRYEAAKDGTILSSQAPMHVVSKPICIKRPHHDVEIPDQIELYTDGGGYNHYNLCEEGSLFAANTCAPEGAVAECRWNRHFSDTHPLSIVLYTLDRSKLADHLRLVRVYRNGDLAYRWLGTDIVDASPFAGEKVLFIPGESLKGSLLPHLAAMDIRIVGVEAPVDAGALREEVRSREHFASVQIHALFDGMKKSAVFKDLKSKYGLDAFKLDVDYVQCLSKAFMTDGKSACSKTPVCPVPTGKTGIDVNLQQVCDLYQSLSKLPAGEVQSAELDASNRLRDVAKQIEQYGNGALNDFKRELETSFRADDKPDWHRLVRSFVDKNLLSELILVRDVPELEKLAQTHKITLDATKTNQDFVDWLKATHGATSLASMNTEAERLMRASLSVVMDTDGLIRRLRDDVHDMTRNDRAKVQLFNEAFQSLQKTPLFEQYADNPRLLPREGALPLEYYTRLQFFSLAPWHGVAWQPSKSVLSPSFNATNLVPVIDVAGVRVQFRKSRFGDFRAALGLSLSYEENADDSKEDTFTMIPQASVGLANLRVGLGYSLFSNPGQGFTTDDLRLVIGADFFKMFSAGNLEAF